jgi:acetyl esterase/lipase
MTIDRRSMLTFAIAASSLHEAPAATSAAAEPEFQALWPQGLPDGDPPPAISEEIVERAAPGAPLRDRLIRHVTRPGITVVRAAQPDGSAVLIVPGGAYQHVVIDKEGLEIAQWMAARGTTAALLRYRLPGDGWKSGPDAPLADAQRALRLLRSHATDWRFDAARVGVIGCSAGGHLSARLLTEAAQPAYAARDAIDRLSLRPDFGALLYPVIATDGPYAHVVSATELLGANADAARRQRYSPDRNVSASTPPVWLVHAVDDPSVPLQNSLDFHAALRAHGIATEMHMFEIGGHGFGLRYTVGKPVAQWPFLLRAWAAQHGFMKRGSTA